MKFLIVFLLFSSNIYSEDSWSSDRAPYSVISDNYDQFIRPGFFRVSGQAYYSAKTTPIMDAIITVEDESVSVNTDSSGYFDLMIPTKYLNIYCYKLAMQEIITGNIFHEQHHVIMEFYLSPQVVLFDSVQPMTPQQTYTYKPVIYIYNDNDEEINIGIKTIGSIDYTYPK